MKKMKVQFRDIAACTLCFMFMVSIVEANETKDRILDKLVVAILSDNYEMFIADGTVEFKKEVTEKEFDAVSIQFNHLTPEGYSSEYLTQLNQSGVTIFLWKVTHKDSEEEKLARLILTDDKVAGFWIQ